ncbi:MAG: OmpA family protein [Deltaproteobacteria bacterium]|nr:OmpA family protein [Deltaproteobacteria bacterium]
MRRMSWMLLAALVAAFLFAGGCTKKQVSVGSSPMTRTGAQTGSFQDGGPADAETEEAKKLRELQERELHESELQDEEARRLALESEGTQGDPTRLAALEEEVRNLVVLFDFDSFELKAEAREKLQVLADRLKTNPGVRLLVEGHTDDRGTEEYNLALGERRARAAYEFLILLGLESGRMQIISYGEEYPAVHGQNESAWAQNRRDEFKIIQ